MGKEVFKFGGASIKDATAVKAAAEIIQTRAPGKLLVVVSAMGKTTNALEEVYYTCLNNREKAADLLQGVFEQHEQVVEELFGSERDQINRTINQYKKECGQILKSTSFSNPAYFYDQLIPYGELLSSSILSFYLNKQGFENEWFDARELIKTDYSFRSAAVDVSKTEIQLSQKLKPFFDSDGKRLAVTQGFIAGADTLNPTTLGREGSDYSASIFAYFLNADSVTIWKDVDGVLNADPKLYEKAQLLSNISYREAIELAYYGASVIHPKTIQPLKEKGIPLYVKCFFRPQNPGTLIDNNTAEDDRIPSFITRKDQRLISLSTDDFAFIAEHNLSDIFHSFSKHQVPIHIMQNSAVNFSVGVDDKETVDRVIEELQKNYKVLYNRNLELLTIRHYDAQTIEELTRGKEVILEQRTRNTARLLVSPASKSVFH